ncbi:MAG TPA: exonuclease domain-containing protein [Candidatus Nanopelagicales bacterium]|nr:exonuclease domain-containing protein [Candidatus Nanopelagicales bacterium]
MSGYTVVDVETTGLSPEHHDRIVEIGVVYVSHDGEIQDHWSTLVNPQRDVGPTRIHGITARDVADAPTFAEIAPYVLRSLSGRIIVAHNARFDLRFLASELVRAGVPLARLPLAGLFPMEWSAAYLAASSRRLVDCCRACGVDLQEAHSAGADALATAQLLTYYLGASTYRPPWRRTLEDCRSYPWPVFHGSYAELRMLHRTDVHARRDDEWLDRVVSRMPRAADPRIDSYLAVLEWALLDGFLAEHEKDQLVAVAQDCGLTRGQLIDLHGSYLRAMAEVAWADGVVTADERALLGTVAASLGLSAHDVERAIRDAGAARTSTAANAVNTLAASGISLARGDRVTFTGDMRRERSEWETIARQHGLVPAGVAKTTKLVIAADPNSLSGKAAKARAYGIPIVTEDAFERIVASVANSG